MWVRVLVIVPPLFTVVALGAGSGLWPVNRRQWRAFGVLLAGFTVLCLVMFCGFHHTNHYLFGYYSYLIR